jgi:hypothetical protein
MVGWAHQTNYQLVLPQVVKQHPLYAQNYHGLGLKPKNFTILDNGAAELGTPLPWNELIQIGLQVKAKEIVLPDVYMDAEGTKKLLIEWEEWYGRHLPVPFTYMAVVHGQSWQEWMGMIAWYSDKYWVDTLGIPRHLLETCGDSRIRVKLAALIEELYPGRFKLHMLGTNPEHMDEVVHLGRMDNIRGIDTSAPFVYAYSGHQLDCGKPFKRPEAYFDMRGILFDYALVETNVMILERWARG